MSKPITDKKQQVTYLKERLEIFLEVLDAIDPGVCQYSCRI